MTPLRLARLSLSRHLFATAITVIAIGLSVACGGILLRLYQLSDSRFAAMGQGGDAIVGAKAGGIEILLGSLNGEGAYPGFLPMKLYESLRSEQSIQHGDGTVTTPSYIRRITPFVYFGQYENSRAVGTDDSFFSRLSFADGASAKETGQIAVGALVAKAHGLKVGDSLDVHPWIGGEADPSTVPLKVSGILAPTGTQWDRTLFATVAQAQQIFERFPAAMANRSIWGTQVLNYFLIDLNDPNGFSALESLINKRTVGQVVGVEAQRARLRELSGVGKSVGLFVTIFVLLLGGLSVSAMLVTRFEGMSLQLAVLRALGYTKKQLARWLLWEGFLLGVMGVVLGAVIDAMGFPFLRELLGAALPPPELVASSPVNSAPIWLAAIAATVASVLIPMGRMARQDAHSSLRGL